MQTQDYSAEIPNKWEIQPAESRIVSPTLRKSLTLDFMDDFLSTPSSNAGSITGLEFLEQTLDSEVPSRVSNSIIFDRKFGELEANSSFKSCGDCLDEAFYFL